MVISVNDSLFSNYFDALGNPGKPVGVDLLDGAIVKSATLGGTGLDIIMQLADGSEMALTYDPTVSAGGGTGNYSAAALYRASDQRLTLTLLGTAPASFGRGDHVLFAAPSNLNRSTDNLKIFVETTDEVDREVIDIDFNMVRPFDLRAGRAYEILRRTSGARWIILEPLKLDQVLPSRRVTRTVSNAQLKTLDTDPIELIAAPGAGNYIEIIRVSVMASGSDLPTEDDSETYPTPDSNDIRGNAFLALVFPDGTTRTLTPYGIFAGLDRTYGGASRVKYWLLRDVIAGADFSSKFRIGSQDFYENQPFQLVLAMNGTNQNRIDQVYSEAAWDAYWATANDNTMTIEVEYFIHD